MSYKTKQKDNILNIIKNKDKEFTVKEIYNEVNDSTGLTTIYRSFERLENEGILGKSIGKDNTTYYYYLGNCCCENHFYLKCDKCGTLIHIDCDCIGDLYKHILNDHKFKLSKEHIIINGICNNCSKEV